MSGLALTKYCCEFDNLNCIFAKVVKCRVILQILLVKCGCGDADVPPMNIYMILSWITELAPLLDAVLHRTFCFKHGSDGTIYRIVSNIAILRYRGISLSR